MVWPPRTWGHSFGEFAQEKHQGAQCYLKKQNQHGGIFFQDAEELSHPEQGKTLDLTLSEALRSGAPGILPAQTPCVLGGGFLVEQLQEPWPREILATVNKKMYRDIPCSIICNQEKLQLPGKFISRRTDKLIEEDIINYSGHGFSRHWCPEKKELDVIHRSFLTTYDVLLWVDATGQ